ncbi:hypothetical protein [Methylocystis sp.]|uniref:hypothetical protein n=1 Tax=Methylocystis sp. TaxID=1911079 RepID=UPI003DA3DD04
MALLKYDSILGSAQLKSAIAKRRRVGEPIQLRRSRDEARLLAGWTAAATMLIHDQIETIQSNSWRIYFLEIS